MNKKKQQFMKWYEEYNDALFRHCYYRVYGREKALEITQETFLRVWNELEKGTKIQYPKTFIFRIATNLIIDDSRKKKEQSLEALQENGFEPDDSTQEEKLHVGIEYEEMCTYLDELDPDDKEILLLRHVEDLKPREIAELLGESANVISVRINRAMKKFQKVLKTHNYTYE